MSVLLISTYDLGRQPFGLASPAAWLRREGVSVETVDVSRDRLTDETIARASLVGFYLPMHTATRLALPAIDRVRRVNPDARICAFGLYAPLNAPLLQSRGVDAVLGPEFEADLAALAAGRFVGVEAAPTLPRLPFIQPDRRTLPPLARYARLEMPDGSVRVAGATEATRGCKHRCRHCPIVPIYNGAFRVVPVDVVLADIRAQVEQGARHITFADPDFFNGPSHAERIVTRLHAEWPDLSYDATIKVEHLLRHRDRLRMLVETGCAFVTTAVESVDDRVLAKLEKGHTRADFIEAAAAARDAGLALAPTFVAFTPWTSIESYVDLLDTIASMDLVEHVAPVQWAIRLLVTEGSRLLELDDVSACLEGFDPASLTYRWRHTDPRVDDLQRRVMALVGVRAGAPRSEVFAAVRALVVDPAACAADALPAAAASNVRARATIPYLNEPWYC